MQIVFNGDSCIKCPILFSWKNVISLLNLPSGKGKIMLKEMYMPDHYQKFSYGVHGNL